LNDGFDRFDEEIASGEFSSGAITIEMPGVEDADGYSQAQRDEIIESCIDNRCFFAEVILGLDLDDWQRKPLEALDSGETRITIRSGNGAGKTCLLAVIAVHYLLFRDDVKIPVTAPSSGQLKDGLIPECSKWIRELPGFLRDMLGKTQDRIVRADSPEIVLLGKRRQKLCKVSMPNM
jgi:hypothetical protein